MAKHQHFFSVGIVVGATYRTVRTVRARMPLMMEVQCVLLECGIVVFGLLRNLLFDVCVNCGVGVFEAVCGKCQMPAILGLVCRCAIGMS